MGSIVAKRRVLDALTRNISSAADQSYSLGNKTLVYSEPIEDYVGMFDVFYVEETIITVLKKDTTKKNAFNSSQIESCFYENEQNLQHTRSQSRFMHGIESTFMTKVIQPYDFRLRL